MAGNVNVERALGALSGAVSALIAAGWTDEQVQKALAAALLAESDSTAPVISETLHVEEAGIVLGISRDTAYKAVASGEIPSIRVGRRLLVPRVQLDRLLRGDSTPDG